MAVYSQGQKIVDVCGGVFGDGDPQPVQPDTLFNCFSVSKAIATLPLLRAIDEGMTSPSTLVQSFWKEFGVKVL